MRYRFGSVIICLSLLVSAGCYQRVISVGVWEKLFREQQKDPRFQNATSDDRNLYAPRRMRQQKELWAVHLDTFSADHKGRARALVRRLKKEKELDDVWIHEKEDGVYVYRGKYHDPTSPEAQNGLRQTRMIQLDGRREYEQARLVLALAPKRAVRSPADDDDSMDVRQHLGKNLYALQVAYFDEDGGNDFRRHAQQYAKQLRKKGYEAYYIHTRASQVIVGLFTYEQAFTTGEVGVQDTYSPAVRLLQEQLPDNLVNGMTTNGADKTQRSFLVHLH